MRFFSKVVFISNVCFIIAVALRLIENLRKKDIVFSGAVKINPVESSFVVLGYSAIIFNALFNLTILIFYISKQQIKIPRWIICFNFILLVIQLYYFVIGI